jgi:DNA-binding NtrC family response regulator
MTTVDWLGTAPSARVRSGLRARGVEIVRRRSSAETHRPAVICSRDARRVPRGTSAHLWIWVSPGPIPEKAATDAVIHGAYDVITLKGPEALGALAQRISELAAQEPEPPRAETIVSVSERSRHIIGQVARVAATSMPVLLTGETGTGKEVMARLIHAWSSRRDKRFIPINCAAIPNDLMEAELFGYARGAFSGAVQRYDGQLMAAEGGTVFLDEIDDTPLETQIKLLRVLEDRVVNRLGENVWHEVDFRILAATNRDLRPLVESGAFGMDLYERLAIVTIGLPPLRERIDDLEPLARFFMARFAREQGRAPVEGIRADALRVLKAYSWPGNIRELRNVMYETLVYKRAGNEIILSDLPRRVLRAEARARSKPVVDSGLLAERMAAGALNLRDEVVALERAALDEALKRAGGNAARAARLLGAVGRGSSKDPGGTVRAMMRRLGQR